MLDLTNAPFPITYRQLWLPRGIKGWTGPLPSSRYNGLPLTLTGARHGTTVDGVHFTGANTSNINCGAIHNNAATLWLSFRFKFDQPYAAGSGDQYIWGKWFDATHFLWLVFKTADGKLYFEGQDGGANDFSIAAQDGAADITTWEAGRWYHVLASISAVNNVRFIINNGTVVTNASAIAAPAGGDFIIGDYDDPGAGTGFEGIIEDFISGIDDLTAIEETDLYKGMPPTDAVNFWPLEEGRGLTAYDRGSGGNNGTLDTAATWAWGQCRQPALTFDGITDEVRSAATADISGNLSVVSVIKAKSVYSGETGWNRNIFNYYVDTNNYLDLIYITGGATLEFRPRGSGSGSGIPWTTAITIDDYLIIIGTFTLSGQSALFVNGTVIGKEIAFIAGGGARPVGGAICCLGCRWDGGWRDISRHLLDAVIEGALSDKQALAYSRFLDRIFNLGLNI